ncbi:MAG: MFS transporter, partial [Thermoplasmatota archaeon]
RRAILGLLRSAARDRGIALASACGALGFIGYGGVLSLLSEHLSSPPFGLSAAAIGSIISASGAAGILFSPLAGWSADRLGRARTSALGLALAGALMSTLGAARDQATLAALFFATGAAMAFGWAGLMTLALELRPEMRGTSSSLFNASRFLGYAAAPQLMAAPFLLSGMGAAFLLAASSLLAASALAASLGSRESGEGRGGRGGGV